MTDKLWPLFLSISLGTVMPLPCLHAESRRPITVDFERDGVLSSSMQKSLQKFAEDMQSNGTTTVQIECYNKGLKPTSLDSIRAQTKSLKIFQALVKSGVDPARISFLETAARPARTDVQLIISTQGFSPTRSLIPEANAAKVAGDFQLSFDSGSAEPKAGSEERFNSFLKAVGQPGQDALEIIGKTDSSGSVAYNQALSELRALRVFEKLARAGVPPYRISTQGKTSQVKKNETEAEKASARSVTLRWIADEKIAAIAAVEDKKISPPADAEPAPTPAPAPAPKTESPQPIVTKMEQPAQETTPDASKPDSHPSLAVVLLAGEALPLASFKNDVKPDFHLGLGLSKNFSAGEGAELRLAFYLAKTSFAPRDSDLKGDLNLTTADLHIDYSMQLGKFRPFAGALFGAYKWSGTINQTTTDLSNEKKTLDTGAGLSLGCDYPVSSLLEIGPLLSWHKIGGSFSGSILTADIAFRWSIP